MNEIFRNLDIKFNISGDICDDTYNLLLKHNFNTVSNHIKRVAEKSKELARKFEYDEQSAEIASYLHDISVIIPNSEKIQVCELLNIEVIEEEREFPLLIHQKLSSLMAKDIYDIKNNEILNSINCHTTLKKDAGKLDLILFVADKIEWDQKGIPPYLDKVEKGLEKSLQHAAYEYIKYMIDNKENLKIIHPWLMQAYVDLKSKLL